MINKKSTIIEAICSAVDRGDDVAVIAAIGEYPFVLHEKSVRAYSAFESTKIFVRDGFVDRYSGARLVNPGVLRLLSTLYPVEFPFHRNWKISEIHSAYWDLVPTIDHIFPVARGGSDSESNWITTSMVRNAAKSSWTPEELGWPILPPGSLEDWDGLTRWFIRYIDNQEINKHQKYVLQWYKAARKILN